MKKLHVSGIIVSLLFMYAKSSAQDTKELDSLLDGSPVSYFKASLAYLNDNVYLGRKDSIKVPYITPEIEYHFKSGIFLNASVSYLPTESRMDASTIGGGYSFSKKKWDAEISAEKYFYNSQSYSVRSEVKGDISASLGYDFGFINAGLSGSISFSSMNDHGGSFNLEHSFLIFDEKADITPSFVINASTQNYYSLYYQKRKYTKKKKGKPVQYTVTANTFDASKFKILDYEGSVPFNYVVKKFTFNFTPTLAVPVNPSTVSLTIKPNSGPSVSRTFTESIGTSLFWSLGISVKL